VGDKEGLLLGAAVGTAVVGAALGCTDGALLGAEVGTAVEGATLG